MTKIGRQIKVHTAEIGNLKKKLGHTQFGLERNMGTRETSFNLQML